MRLLSLYAFICFVINHCLSLCCYVITTVRIRFIVRLDPAIREFLRGLEDMATSTGLEHWKYLFIDPQIDGLGYWLLIINLGQ